MSTSLSLYAPQPGSPGIPAASRTGVLVGGMVNALGSVQPPLDLQLHWLDPPGPVDDWASRARWSAGELRRILRDRSKYLMFVYPDLPVLAYDREPAMLTRVRRGLQALQAKVRVSRQRIVVVVDALPAEKAAGRAEADGRTPDPEIAERFSELERPLLGMARLLVLPEGFVDAVGEYSASSRSHIHTFRRHAYLPKVDLGTPPPIEFDGGKVNFFYSGEVDRRVAPNFREILRSIRNAPDTRLHVCGPGRDAVSEWLTELDVPNVRHHGQLAPPEHDWLASQCDVGLILYPADDPYEHLRPTLKYSAYLANGLAILATDLRCVAENVRRDDVGHAMPIRELALELLRWATRPKLWAGAKARATELAPAIRSGTELRPVIERIAAGA